MDIIEEKPQNREETGRNPDGTFKAGVSGNPGGRPKNSLKSYLGWKLAEMSDEEKELWIENNKISGELQWRMAEGNPSNDNKVDVTSKGEKIEPTISTEVIAIAKEELKKRLTNE